MGRIVRAKGPSKGEIAIPIGKAIAHAGLEAPQTLDHQEQGDDYLNRVAKYVPAEIVAFFIFVNAILSDALTKSMAQLEKVDTNQTTSDLLAKAMTATEMAGFGIASISWALLAIALVMVPVYLISLRDPGDKLEYVGLNIIMSMLAFPVWAYAVDAVAFRPFHDGALASILLATFSIVSGAISPDGLRRIAEVFGWNSKPHNPTSPAG